MILEVDLEYPQELHDLHNDYPLAPEKTKVSSGMLSEYCKKIADKYNISIGLVNKLIPTLRDKEGYVLHYRNLQALPRSQFENKESPSSAKIRSIPLA